MIVKSQPSREQGAYNAFGQSIDGKYVEEGKIALHDPDLYRADSVAEMILDFESVNDKELQCFHEHGFIVIENAYSSGEVRDAIDGLEDLALGKYPDFEGIIFESAIKDRLDDLREEERLDGIRKMVYFVDFEARLQAMAEHQKLLTLLRQLIGSDDLTMFQDMALIKPPLIGREKPWHQDCAYFDFSAERTIVGVWIALDQAEPDNGCMYVLDGGHLEGPQIHFERRDWQICDTDIVQLRSKNYPVVEIPLKPGGCLLFNGLLPHGTPRNSSDKRRRALQFHYRSVNTMSISLEERLAVFGSEGKNVNC